ncbi:MAG: helix-turn-helix domain-containing protein, partial [Planctomycetota bacterium]
YARLEGDEYPILKLGEKSKQVLFQNEKVFLTKPLEKHFIQKVAAGDNYDRVLFDRLRALRKTAADKEGVPPYVIFHDTSLKEMSISYPGSLADLRKISGVGEMKLKKYGDAFLKEIINYCTQHGIKQKPSTLKYQDIPIKQQKSFTTQVTFDLYKQGFRIKEIAARRGLAPSTISSHLEKLILDGETVALDNLMSLQKQQRIKQVCLEMDTELLTPLKEKLGEDYSYEEIRLVRAQLIMEERND